MEVILLPLLRMGVGVIAAVVAISTTSCASAPSSSSIQNPNAEIVLKLGASERVPNTRLTVTFESVVEDSRCPTGVACVREGDAAVKIRIAAPGTAAASYTVHTNLQSAREAEHGNARVRLVSVAPHPTADSKPRPDEYRVTLLITGK